VGLLPSVEWLLVTCYLYACLLFYKHLGAGRCSDILCGHACLPTSLLLSPALVAACLSHACLFPSSVLCRLGPLLPACVCLHSHALQCYAGCAFTMRPILLLVPMCLGRAACIHACLPSSLPTLPACQAMEVTGPCHPSSPLAHAPAFCLQALL
jgi:hypothetical protein